MKGSELFVAWYNYDRINSYNATLNFILTNRGFGKTFGAKCNVIKKFIKKGEQFVYVRRYKTELNDIHKFFDSPDLRKKFKTHTFEVKGKTFYIDGKIAGYAIALSTSQKLKSVDYPFVTTIIFDEFIVDKGCIRYLTNEVDVFLDLYETIARKRNNVKAYLLANNVSIVNPYFTYFDVTPKKTERFTIARDGELVVEMCTDTVFINEKLETKFGKLIKGTKYADYSIYNNSLRDSEVFIEKRPKRNTSPVMSITYNGETAMIWLDYKTGIFYCDDKYMKTCNEYVLSCEDHNPSTLLNASGINLNMLKQLISYFQVGRVRFSDQNIKHLMYDIFRSLGVK